MILPSKLFFTGVPGSKWSGIAQILEQNSVFNTSDRTTDRQYDHHAYTGHKGAYFGAGMELPADLDNNLIDSAWESDNGCKIVKSHDWATKLIKVKKAFPIDWIMLVYRPDLISYAWWHEAGGFQIKYPDYSWYGDSIGMLSEITRQNKMILDFAYKFNAKWEYFTEEWIQEQFGIEIKNVPQYNDILVTVIK